MARNLLAATVCGTKHAAIPADLSKPLHSLPKIAVPQFLIYDVLWEKNMITPARTLPPTNKHNPAVIKRRALIRYFFASLFLISGE